MWTSVPMSLKAASILLALTTLTFATIAAAQDYPTKPVRVIIPFPPGAINDTVGRLIATQLTNRLGKQFIVDNRAGAGGVVGTELAANAPKDGYTLLVVSLVNTVNPWLYKLNYEPIKSFAPIAFLASSPNILVVNPQVPAKTLAEFIALAKKQPGKMQYASGGVGSFMHLGGELFKLSAGIDLLHVPFRGGGPAMTDVMGGHTNAAFATIPTSTPQVKAGKVRGVGRRGREAPGGAAGRPHRRRSRTAGLSRRQLGRHRGAGRRTACDRRQAEQGNRGDHAIAGDAEAAREPGPGIHFHDPGRVRHLHGEGIGQMGTRREGGRHQAAMNSTLRHFVSPGCGRSVM